MLLFPSAVFRPRRARARRTPPGPTPPVAPLAVLDVEDVFIEPEVGVVTCVFNTTAGDPIGEVDSANPAKWTVRYDNQRYAGSSLEKLSFDRVRIGLAIVEPDEGPNVIGYAGPSDISDALGRQLAAFSDLPL
jgi:hypothetical protein